MEGRDGANGRIVVVGSGGGEGRTDGPGRQAKHCANGIVSLDRRAMRCAESRETLADSLENLSYGDAPAGGAERGRMMADRDADLTGEGDAITPDAVARLYAEAGPRIVADLELHFEWPLAGFEPEDVVHETAARLLKSPRKFDPHRGKLEDFFFGMCVKVAQEFARKVDHRRKHLGTEADSDVLDEIPADDEHSDYEPPLDALRRTILHEEIPKLPDHERKIIEADLKAGGAAPAEPLARELGCHPSTIRSRRKRIHNRLRKILRRRRSGGEVD